jgi:hypothetical protein
MDHSVAGNRILSGTAFGSSFSIRLSRTSTARYSMSNVGCLTHVMLGEKIVGNIHGNIQEGRQAGCIDASQGFKSGYMVANNAEGLPVGLKSP